MGLEERERDEAAIKAANSKEQKNVGKDSSALVTREERTKTSAASVGEQKCVDGGEQTSSGTCSGSNNRRKYTREWLLALKIKPELTTPPQGFNPALLKPCDSSGGFEGRGPGWRGREGWHPPAGLGKGQIHSRLVDDGGMDAARNSQDQPGDGKWLTTRPSWRAEGPFPQAPPRRSRSDQPGRWDANKPAEETRSGPDGGGQQQHSGSEHRWPEYSKGERWGSYGHRDKPQYRDANEGSGWQEPEWMHDVPAEDDKTSTAMSQKDRAAVFEEQRQKAKESWSKKGGAVQGVGQRLSGAQLMTDEEIDKMMNSSQDQPSSVLTHAQTSVGQTGNEPVLSLPVGTSNTATFSFDSLKEAFKQAGAPNLPPLPTSFSTVTEIEKGMQPGRVPKRVQALADLGGPSPTPPALGLPQWQMPPMPSEYKSVGDLERERYGIAGAGAGTATAAGASGAAAVGIGGVPHPGSNGPMDGANFLLSLLKGSTNAGAVHPGMGVLPGNPAGGQLPPHLIPGMGVQGNGNFAGFVGQPESRQENVLGRLFAAAAQKNTPPSAGILGLGFGSIPGPPSSFPGVLSPGMVQNPTPKLIDRLQGLGALQRPVGLQLGAPQLQGHQEVPGVVTVPTTGNCEPNPPQTQRGIDHEMEIPSLVSTRSAPAATDFPDSDETGSEDEGKCPQIKAEEQTTAKEDITISSVAPSHSTSHLLEQRGPMSPSAVDGAKSLLGLGLPGQVPGVGGSPGGLPGLDDLHGALHPGQIGLTPSNVQTNNGLFASNPGLGMDSNQTAVTHLLASLQNPQGASAIRSPGLGGAILPPGGGAIPTGTQLFMESCGNGLNAGGAQAGGLPSPFAIDPVRPVPLGGQNGPVLDLPAGHQQEPLNNAVGPRGQALAGTLGTRGSGFPVIPGPRGVQPNLLLPQQAPIGFGHLQNPGAGLSLMSSFQQSPYIRGVPQGNPLVAHDPGFVVGRGGIQLGGGFPASVIRPAGFSGVVRPPGAGLPPMDGLGISQNQGWVQSQLPGIVARQQDPLLMDPNTLAQLQGIQNSQTGQRGLERFFNLNAVGAVQPANVQAKPSPI